MTVVELSNGPLRDWLRAETRPIHDRIDAVFSRLSEGGLHGKIRFLRAQALAAPGVAAAVHARKGVPFAADFNPAPASALLAADLAALGAAMPAAMPSATFENDETAAGAAYTLAGSRLGARVLDREWRTAGEGAFASRYLAAENLFGDWRGFCDALAAIGAAGADKSAILAGALAAFDHFEAAARTALEITSADE